ncbi:MAG: carbohydrate kinase family protein [Promethearchaeota archaeon]
MTFEVIAIGSCTLDCIIQVSDILRFELFKKNIIKKYTAIEYSQKLNLENITFVPGGSGANIASNCAMLGLKSAYIGVLGKDFSAQICLEDMKKRKVDLSQVKQVENEKTAFSVILKSEWGKDRSILAYKGANNLLQPSDIKDELFTDIKAFAWTSLTSKNGCKAIEKAISLTKKYGGKVYAAPSMSIIKNNPKWARTLISKSDVVSFNLEEANEFTGEREYHDIIHHILSLGPQLVSITDGSNGSYLSNGEESIQSGVYDVEVQDTTGAGDAFMSGIVLSTLNGYSLKKIAQFASAMSALECQQFGVREGIPSTFEELKKFTEMHELKQYFHVVHEE